MDWLVRGQFSLDTGATLILREHFKQKEITGAETVRVE